MRIAPLLLTGIFTLSVVSPVSAAGDQYADIPPVSPYMERVVRRAREGLNNGSGGGSTADELLKLFWLDRQHILAAYAPLDPANLYPALALQEEVYLAHRMRVSPRLLIRV